jgi:K+-transporting ATPase KdpF subunit
MSAGEWVLLVIGEILLVYLLYALLRPERF